MLLNYFGELFRNIIRELVVRNVANSQVLVFEDTLGKSETTQAFKLIVAKSQLLKILNFRDEFVDGVTCLTVDIVLI